MKTIHYQNQAIFIDLYTQNDEEEKKLQEK